MKVTIVQPPAPPPPIICKRGDIIRNENGTVLLITDDSCAAQYGSYHVVTLHVGVPDGVGRVGEHGYVANLIGFTLLPLGEQIVLDGSVAWLAVWKTSPVRGEGYYLVNKEVATPAENGGVGVNLTVLMERTSEGACALGGVNFTAAASKFDRYTGTIILENE